MNVANYIDHTLLTADCTIDGIQRICDEAKEHGFYAVCVPPYYVKKASRILKDSPIKLATVIGFPMGYSTTSAKVDEIRRAVDEHADELDVVVNVCAIKNGNWNYVENDISSMITAVHMRGKLIKIILETSLLTKEEILRLCEICNQFKPNFVKTSTGYNGGATIEDISFLRENLHKDIKIKASGGIKNEEEAIALINAGANRIGSSSGVAIVAY